MNRLSALLASALLFSVSALSQGTALRDSLLDRMIGKWVLHGTIGGQQTTHDVVIDWVLAHEYVRLQEVSREKDTLGNPAYEAIVFIGQDKTPGQYACLWLDNTGGGGLNGQAIGHGRRDGDSIPFLFQGSDGSLFHTTFAYDRLTDSWQWLMDGEEGGKLQPFARVRLTK